MHFFGQNRINTAERNIFATMNIKKALARLVLKIYGWKFIDNKPKNLKKYVLIAAPHTSNFDFTLAIASLWIGDIKGNYLIKKEHFWWPMSIFMNYTGGIAVDRENLKHNFTKTLINLMKDTEETTLLFTPEGTRSRVEKWKTGFHRVAKACAYPVVPAYADYAKKEIGFGEPFYPSDHVEEDLKMLEEFYSDKTARYPEKFNPRFFVRNGKSK